jgi:chloramphenicol-sensitive protein RarD
MLFGFMLFGERQNRLQCIAIGTALCGVLLQIPAVGHFPWVALTLAVTFSLYAVVKKRSPMDSRLGLTGETLMLSPIALGWLIWQSSRGTGISETLLVVIAGLATTLPLLCFGHAARNIRLTTLGILQFLGPTLQFLIGWKFFGEAMSPARLGSFSLIWLAVGLYAYDALHRTSKARIQ